MLQYITNGSRARRPCPVPLLPHVTSSMADTKLPAWLKSPWYGRVEGILNHLQFPGRLSFSTEPAETPLQPRHHGQLSSVLLHHFWAAWRSRAESLMLPNSSPRLPGGRSTTFSPSPVQGSASAAVHVGMKIAILIQMAWNCYTYPNGMKIIFFMEIAILIQMAWNLYSRLWRAYMSCCSFLRIYCVILIYGYYFVYLPK